MGGGGRPCVHLGADPRRPHEVVEEAVLHAGFAARDPTGLPHRRSRKLAVRSVAISRTADVPGSQP